MDGQAESAPESGNLADLASFLDQPDEQESTEEIEATADEPTSDEGDTGEEADSDSDDTDLEESGEDEETAPAETKVTFKVKNEDGTEETVEFTPDELPKALMRQKDYTKKTQALAERETQAVQFLQQKHEEIRADYLSRAEVTRAAIVNMAGIKSENELAQLAHSDPAAWVAEQQRQKQIGAYISELDQQIRGEKQAAEQQAQQRNQAALQQQYQKTWEVLEQQKIDKPKLADIYGKATKNYGFSSEELGNVYDHRLVLALKDAAAYRDLQSKRGEVTKKAESAPRMPTRQGQPAQERKDMALEKKFKSGRAKLNDLAAYLA
jgi:flagellar biosynthesis chaperone FliJ